MDNVSWHKRKATNWHNWQPMYLPPYLPALNPIERIWLTMKARWFNNNVCKNEEKLL
jgi:transposase